MYISFIHKKKGILLKCREKKKKEKRKEKKKGRRHINVFLRKESMKFTFLDTL